VGRRRSAVAEREAVLLERQLHLYASELYSYAPMSRAAVLGLEDGSVWWGEAFGDASSASGEVVFNTAMTGYQEVASDASYNGQLVVMTYPLIGNYGVFDRASESRKPWVEALVVRELNATCREGTEDLDSYLRANGVPGIAGVEYAGPHPAAAIVGHAARRAHPGAATTRARRGHRERGGRARPARRPPSRSARSSRRRA